MEIRRQSVSPAGTGHKKYRQPERVIIPSVLPVLAIAAFPASGLLNTLQVSLTKAPDQQ